MIYCFVAKAVFLKESSIVYPAALRYKPPFCQSFPFRLLNPAGPEAVMVLCGDGSASERLLSEARIGVSS